MFTRPYSIYVDKRPLRIAFLVDPSQDSIEIVDQIMDYNRNLWGGRFNPVILTDGNTIDPKWWQFLREVDPDIIKSLIPLDIGLIEKFDRFLSPLVIEEYQEDTWSDLGLWIKTGIKPASIDSNSLDIYKDLILFGEPVLGAFNVEEMDDEIARLFLQRNFGVFARTTWHGGWLDIGWDAFDIPISLETELSRGEVPPEVHERFKKKGLPLSTEVFSKNSKRFPENWAIIDRENNLIHYVARKDEKLLVHPYRQSTRDNFDAIERKICLVTNRRNLGEALLELSHTANIVYRDQICAFPNTEPVGEKAWQNPFEVIVGDTLQDIICFWNRPWLLDRRRRKSINQIWLPTTIATDPVMEDALCSWINRNSGKLFQDSQTVQFVSFSIAEERLKSIADRLEKKLTWSTTVKVYEEPQIPNLQPEDPLSFLREDSFSHRDSSPEVHRAQDNTYIFELTEPNGLVQRDIGGHWMADFYIQFTHNKYENEKDVIAKMRKAGTFLLWQFPKNYRAGFMFDRPIRIRQNGFPSALMEKSKRVLKLTLNNSEAVVASLFSKSIIAYNPNDLRSKLTDTSYDRAKVSDKGKYLQGVFELFGNLTFAYVIFKGSYWREMFDLFSKNTRAEQNAEDAVANKIRKLIHRSGPLTSAKQDAIKSLAKQAVNLARDLPSKQKEFPFKAFLAEYQQQIKKNIDDTLLANYQHGVDLLFQLFDPDKVLAFANRQYGMDMVDFSSISEDVKDELSRLTQRNIIQIGIKPQCPSCGMTYWYHVDDIGQQLTCQGCRVPFPLPLELTWQYRLNSLVHAAYASHGVPPVIFVLGQLLNESEISFLFSPNLNLLTRRQNESSEKYETVAEVDIACIQDGKFIIGEVKQSMNLFRKKDFDDMAEIAKRIKPDRVLFSCVDSKQPTKFITGHIERIKKELSPFEIDVQWYKLY